MGSVQIRQCEQKDFPIVQPLFAVCAAADGEVVGMGRIVGDGAIKNTIQDLIVLPEHQGRGIGARIMDAIMAWLKENASPGPGSDVSLFTRRENECFYERYGFAESVPEKPSMRRKL